MNKADVHTHGARVFELHRAILLYQCSQGGGQVYATLHQVERNRPGGPHLAAGVPATQENCAEFARAIADRAAFSGFLSPNLLYIGPRVVAWWRPPAPARVWFKTEDADKPERHIGERSAITPHPGLVFIVAEGNWSVFALKGGKRPAQDEQLYRAPYFNVWLGGRICEGNIERPNRVTPETIATFERAFFESRFTHSNVQRSRDITSYEGGIYVFWRALLDGKYKAFPERFLIRERFTLVEQLRTLERGKDER